MAKHEVPWPTDTKRLDEVEAAQLRAGPKTVSETAATKTKRLSEKANGPNPSFFPASPTNCIPIRWAGNWVGQAGRRRRVVEPLVA